MCKYFFIFLTLMVSLGLTLLSGCGMGEANKHLDAMEKSTHLMATNIYSLQEELTHLNSNLGSIAGSMASINSSVNSAGQIMSVLQAILPTPGTATVSTATAQGSETTPSEETRQQALSDEQQRQSSLLGDLRRTLETLQRQMEELKQQQTQLQLHLDQQERSRTTTTTPPTEPTESGTSSNHDSGPSRSI